MDRIFRTVARGAGLLVLVLMAAIALFLLLEGQLAFRTFGWDFFTQAEWNIELNQLGVAAALLGTVLIAAIAIVFAFPLALTTALYISEYSPPRLKRTFIALVDLMAAVPSVVYGIWVLVFAQEEIIYFSRWLHQAFGALLPFMDLPADPDAAAWEQSRYTSSMFIAGIAVAAMVLPIACSVMREVFSQAPPGEREAALALGATRWGMIRSVVLPFGRGGIIGGTMLGLGRALGETIAVALIISPVFEIKFRILETGAISISSLIVLRFGESSAIQLSALMLAGLVLFIFTLLINTMAAVMVARSRSGATTEI